MVYRSFCSFFGPPCTSRLSNSAYCYDNDMKKQRRATVRHWSTAVIRNMHAVNTHSHGDKVLYDHLDDSLGYFDNRKYVRAGRLK